MRPSITASENAVDRRTAALRHMTADQLRGLGTHQLVYLRAGMCEGERLLVLYGADGEPLTTADDVETAVEIAAEQGLKFISVH